MAKGERYAQHAARKFVRNHTSEIMPSINNTFNCYLSASISNGNCSKEKVDGRKESENVFVEVMDKYSGEVSHEFGRSYSETQKEIFAVFMFLHSMVAWMQIFHCNCLP